ncbi:piggyBac transposable element-derived protein 4-like [Periophthalmus magnuspinnatus]|uniref:piggyBac transposable element-derived protein 4-like n=1 Tax=Periophthalmus magnuspinnatus TaxID=409849 RepID=UPI002436E6BE|nr:piggyBac transposable element-derived protein 4-like [Periophthalmus magnuspinnatus]
MATLVQKTRYTVEEALKLIEEDNDATVCVHDSSSEDEDLLHPANSDSGSEYCPSSESESDEDEDYEPPKKATKQTAPAPPPKFSPRPLSSEASSTPPPSPTFQPLSSEASSTPPSSPTFQPLSPKASSTPLPRPTPQPLSPSPSTPTTVRKRGRPPGTSPPSKKRRQNAKRLFAPSEGEDRWRNREEEDITPHVPSFMPVRTPGPNIDTSKNWSPLSLFHLYFSTKVVKTIINNTNANAARKKAGGMAFKWEDLTVKDFYIFLSIILFMGLVPVPQRSDYWRARWPYNFPFPRKSMTRDRFEAIMWSLHLSNLKEDEENERKKHTPDYDRLQKIKPLYTDIIHACRSFFQPYQHISIDERMVATKARISIKQYIKNKPIKWGYKLFVLADSLTGYTWNFFVYTGKSASTSTASHGLGYSTVMDLMPLGLLGRGYKLYTDNFYTSATLLNDLLELNTAACGTLRKNHVDFPQSKNDLPKNAQRGDMRWMRSGQLLFVKWMDTREVAICSTIHKADSGQTVKRKVKEDGLWQTKDIPVPDSIVDYNANMGGVDLSDALIGYYTVHHKTKKWYKTFFYHFLDIAIVNSFLLHKELFKQRQDPTQTKPLTQKVFREQLGKEMLDFAEASAASADSTSSAASATSTSSAANNPMSPTKCVPGYYDGDGRVRKHCKWCLEQGIPRVKTPVYCKKCSVPLCFVPKRNCYELWHERKQKKMFS